VKTRGLVIGLALSVPLWAGLIWAAVTIAHTGIVGAFLDGATRVPFVIWVLLVACGVLFWIAFVTVCAEYTTPEQREEIARAHRELRGTRGMGSAGSTSTTRREPPWEGAPLTRHRRAASAHGPRRPGRDRN